MDDYILSNHSFRNRWYCHRSGVRNAIKVLKTSHPNHGIRLHWLMSYAPISVEEVLHQAQHVCVSERESGAICLGTVCSGMFTQVMQIRVEESLKRSNFLRFRVTTSHIIHKTVHNQLCDLIDYCLLTTTHCARTYWLTALHRLGDAVNLVAARYEFSQIPNDSWKIYSKGELLH